MLTKCPHCETKFKASDDLKGKNAKCPKCRQSFTISDCVVRATPPIQATKDLRDKVEICANCRRGISKRDKAYSIDGKIFCAECGINLGRSETVQDGKHKSEPSLCFFCQKNAPQEESVCRIPMFKGINFGDSFWKAPSRWEQFMFHTRVSYVPRCERCKSLHDRRDKYQAVWFKIGGFFGAFFGIFLGIYIVISLTQHQGFEVFYFVVTLFGCIILGYFFTLVGLIFGRAMAALTLPSLLRDVKPQRYGQEYPSVKQLAAKEWRFGEKPDAYEKYGTIEVIRRKRRLFGVLAVFSRIGWLSILIGLFIMPLIRDSLPRDVLSRDAVGENTFHIIRGLLGMLGIIGCSLGLLLEFLKRK